MGPDLDRLIQDLKDARAEFEARLDEVDTAKERYYATVRRLYQAGMPLRDIADVVGVSHQRVHQIVGEDNQKGRVRRAAAKHARTGGLGVVALVLVGS